MTLFRKLCFAVLNRKSKFLQFFFYFAKVLLKFDIFVKSKLKFAVDLSATVLVTSIWNFSKTQKQKKNNFASLFFRTCFCFNSCDMISILKYYIFLVTFVIYKNNHFIYKKQKRFLVIFKILCLLL